MNKKLKRNIIIAAVALVLALALILLIFLLPSGKGKNTPADLDPGIDMTASVNEDGLHTVKINTNSKGEIENNSYGTLVDRLPAEVEKIVMKTQEGNYTFLVENPVNEDGSTEASVYTLEGFEEYDLADTNPALLAGDVCNVEFTKVADLSGEGAAEYGFENPRSEATVYYSDGTYSVVRVGDDAPGAAYTYVQFADSPTVYVVKAEEVDSMLLKITDLFNTTINSDKTSVSDGSFDQIILGGTHLEEEIVIKTNTEGSLTCSYVMASHNDLPVNNTKGSEVVGTIKSLATDEVVCVNPDDAQLEEYGLSKPYATVKTNYSYSESTYDNAGNEIKGEPQTLKVSLLASKEDAEGNVYMMQEGGKLVYRISADSVVWATVSFEELVSEYVLHPNYQSLESVSVESKGKTYKFEFSTEDVTTTGEDGTTTTIAQPRVRLAGKEVDPDQFQIFFQDLVLMETAGEDDGTKTTGELLKITYNYATQRDSDTVILYSTDTQKVIPELNSMKNGYIYKSYANALAENLEKLVQGKEITDIE
ncbi:MAG: DUF4340 domain-containing protein [Ruminococcus sp.]|nr:DUF4340 domain-containing protein [Ruminococcus sp.]